MPPWSPRVGGAGAAAAAAGGVWAGPAAHLTRPGGSGHPIRLRALPAAPRPARGPAAAAPQRPATDCEPRARGLKRRGRLGRHSPSDDGPGKWGARGVEAPWPQAQLEGQGVVRPRTPRRRWGRLVTACWRRRLCPVSPAFLRPFQREGNRFIEVLSDLLKVAA